MIAIDLDGTLLSPSSQVTPRTRAAIHGALRAGFLVCFATGRNFTESQTVLDAVAHYDSAVFVGGAMVIDTRQRITLHRTAMDPSLARELSQFFESHGQAVLALQDTGHVGVDYLISKGVELHASTRKWIKETHATIHFADDLPNHAHDHTIRIGIVTPLKQAEPILAELQRRFGPRITSHRFDSLLNDVCVVEAFDPSVNKWEGILHVARRHKIDPSEIIAIGDEINDVTMVANAGLGVAMGNSHPDLLKHAKKVIGHNRDDGLAEFLEELIATNPV